MNNLSRGVKFLLCILVGISGLVIIPLMWIGWQKSLGFKTPGALFIFLIWVVTIAAISGILRYKREEDDGSNQNNPYSDNDKHKLNKS